MEQVCMPDSPNGGVTTYLASKQALIAIHIAFQGIAGLREFNVFYAGDVLHQILEDIFF